MIFFYGKYLHSSCREDLVVVVVVMEGVEVEMVVVGVQEGLAEGEGALEVQEVKGVLQCNHWM